MGWFDFFSKKNAAQREEQLVHREQALEEAQLTSQRDELALLREAVKHMHDEQRAIANLPYAANSSRALEELRIKMFDVQRELLNARSYGRQVTRRARTIERFYKKRRDVRRDNKLQYLVDDERQILTKSKSANRELKTLANKAQQLANQLHTLTTSTPPAVGTQIATNKTLAAIANEITALLSAITTLVDNEQAIFKLEQTVEQLQTQFLKPINRVGLVGKVAMGTALALGAAGTLHAQKEVPAIGVAHEKYFEASYPFSNQSKRFQIVDKYTLGEKLGGDESSQKTHVSIPESHSLTGLRTNTYDITIDITMNTVGTTFTSNVLKRSDVQSVRYALRPRSTAPKSAFYIEAAAVFNQQGKITGWSEVKTTNVSAVEAGASWTLSNGRSLTGNELQSALAALNEAATLTGQR